MRRRRAIERLHRVGNPTSQILQNFQDPQGAGSAQTFAAGTQPTAQSLSQLQMALQKLGATGAQGQKSPAMQAMGLGQQMMQMGQQQAPRPQLPMARPVGAPMPLQGAIPPTMGGGMMGGNMGLSPAQLNMMLAQRNGLMG